MDWLISVTWSCKKVVDACHALAQALQKPKEKWSHENFPRQPRGQTSVAMSQLCGRGQESICRKCRQSLPSHWSCRGRAVWYGLATHFECLGSARLWTPPCLGGGSALGREHGKDHCHGWNRWPDKRSAGWGHWCSDYRTSWGADIRPHYQHHRWAYWWARTDRDQEVLWLQDYSMHGQYFCTVNMAMKELTYHIVCFHIGLDLRYFTYCGMSTMLKAKIGRMTQHELTELNVEEWRILAFSRFAKISIGAQKFICAPSNSIFST